MINSAGLQATGLLANGAQNVNIEVIDALTQVDFTNAVFDDTTDITIAISYRSSGTPALNTLYRRYSAMLRLSISSNYDSWDWSAADVSNTVLTGFDFSGADVSDVVWTGATCPSGVTASTNGGTCCGQLNDVSLTAGCSPDYSGQTYTGTDFSSADLENADFTSSILTNIDFQNGHRRSEFP